MATTRSLPDLRTRVTVDRKELDALPGSAKKTSAALKSELGASSASAKALETRLGALGGALGHLGPAGQVAGSALQDVTSAASALGVVGGVAAGGLVAMAGVLSESVKKYIDLASHVEDYRRVVGSSAEESGRMVQTFEALGVSEETATNGMFKLSKAIENNPEKLKALGVEVAHLKDGNVDLSQTLLDLADAYNATGDQTKKNAILFTAFGKSGKDMVPILEQGSSRLRELEEAARITFSAEDLERARQYKIQLAELKQGWDSIWESIGQKVVPVLVAAGEKMDRTAYITKHLGEALNDGTLSWGDFQKASLGSETAGNGIVKTLGAEWDAAHKLKGALDEQAAATLKAAQANEELWATADKVISQQEAQANAGDALQLAQLAVSESQGRVNQANEDYAAAVAKYGAGSDEALRAANDITRAQIEQERQLRAVGSAARKLQEDTDLLSGTTKNVALDVQAEIDALQNEAATLAPGSPLRKYLEGYINDLQNRIPRDVQTRITLVETHLSGRQGGNLTAYAEGGRPPVGRDVWVGEYGPELARFDRPATIYPNGQAPAAAGGDTYHTHLTLNGTSLVDTPEDVARTLQRMQALGAAGQ